VKWLGILVAVSAAVAVLLVWRLRERSPEQLIEEKVLNMAAAAEKKDLGYIMDQVSGRFRASSPPLSRDDLRQLLGAEFLRGQWIRVFVRDMSVQLESPTGARFRGKFILGTSTAESLQKLAAESRIQAWEIDAGLEKESDDEWRFVSGSFWRIPAGQLF
jgi:hypothetical protein